MLLLLLNAIFCDFLSFLFSNLIGDSSTFVKTEIQSLNQYKHFGVFRKLYPKFIERFLDWELFLEQGVKIIPYSLLKLKILSSRIENGEDFTDIRRRNRRHKMFITNTSMFINTFMTGFFLWNSPSKYFFRNNKY